MDRARDLPGWPHADRSRFVRVGATDWHVQEMGDGPLVLFLHGSGASTHSWRDVLPRMAPRWRCVAVDLPGQGFTRAASLRRVGLLPMAEAIAALCAAEGWAPVALVGHSAGAALALGLSRRLPGAPPVVGINAALAEFEGPASWLFPVIAKLLAVNPLTVPLFTLGSGPARARRLIEGTGSRLDAEGLALYARLIGDRAHVEGTLQMMAQWRIADALVQLPQVIAPVVLLAADGDRAVPPATSDAAARRLPNATVVRLQGLGHLAQEEDPAGVARRVEEFLARVCPR